MLPAGEDPLPGGSNLPDPCPKKCKYCLQRLDVVESVPVEDYVAGKEPKSERQAVRDPTLAVMGLVSVFVNSGRLLGTPEYLGIFILLCINVGDF